MRVSFQQVFQENADGSLSPLVQVQIGGITMSPGMAFGGGVSFGGVDLHELKGRDLDVEIQNGVYVIKGYFRY
jgi:hypothetical protein